MISLLLPSFWLIDASSNTENYGVFVVYHASIGTGDTLRIDQDEIKLMFIRFDYAD